MGGRNTETGRKGGSGMVSMDEEKQSKPASLAASVESLLAVKGPSSSSSSSSTNLKKSGLKNEWATATSALSKLMNLLSRSFLSRVFVLSLPGTTSRLEFQGFSSHFK
ncbi:unnamed protein product [Cuscuta campestris]|uniref:Uncharacterized protein n=1 Tax=Cuscuta campestris TaxID=132261 RepID=A0A484L1K6_9ASTE|nr:unnamed protein product [Cuscuta campestris]